MEAFDIARKLSMQEDNPGRVVLVRSLLSELFGEDTHVINEQATSIDEIYGCSNFRISSGMPAPLMLVAHYDSFVYEEDDWSTVPGANDNGSGVGAIIEAMGQLEGFPVDIALLGGGSQRCHGAITFISEMRNRPVAVVNVEAIGRQGDMGVAIPSQARTGSGLVKTDIDLNQAYIGAAESLGVKVCLEDALGIGEHSRFIEAGFSGAAIRGTDKNYFGAVNAPRRIWRTNGDNISCLDGEFLKKIVAVLVNGSKLYLKERRFLEYNLVS